MSNDNAKNITIVGGGLAGSELALQLAHAGRRVKLYEMKSERRTPAQKEDNLAELVCSNSLRAEPLTNAVGLLKEEMRRLGSFIMAAADEHRVPAGGALAVDRVKFSGAITHQIEAHPDIELIPKIVEELPGSETDPFVIATGPLTDDALAGQIERAIGKDRLYFYDAISPIVDASTIDMEIAWRQSRYDKGGADYLNLPLAEEQYHKFVEEILAAEKVEPRDFEKPHYFEGCLPVEIIAARGPETLSFGCMKPVGLTDPRTGARPYGVVQLRAENKENTAYNLVGFQTKMTYPEQERVFRMLPGLENASFLRFGSIHRNTFIDSPRLLDERMRLRSQPHIRFAGQISGVEGYVESAAHALLLSFILRQETGDGEPSVPPPTTAHGALLTHLANVDCLPFQPSNVNFGQFPKPPGKLKGRNRKEYLAAQALRELAGWIGMLERAGVGLVGPAREVVTLGG